MNEPLPAKTYLVNPVILIQLILEFLIIIGYIIGIFGALFLSYYVLVAWWLIPAAIASLVLGISENSGTEKHAMANFVCSLFALVPVLGLLPSVAGIVLASFAIIKILPGLQIVLTTPTQNVVNSTKATAQKRTSLNNTRRNRKNV